MKRYPAFAIGLHLLLGCACALNGHWILGLPLLLLFYFSPFRYAGTLLSLAFFLYVTLLYPSPSFSEKRVEGEGYFVISALKEHSSHFKKSYLYRGTLKTFCAEDGSQARSLPCSIYHPIGQRPLANQDYQIKGTLIQKSEHNYHFKPKTWMPVEKTFCFAEMRHKSKEKVRSYFKKHIRESRAASFLNALATGDIEEHTLALEFGKLGLQHILAISGFHFGLLALFLGFFLRLFFSQRQATVLCLLLLTSYAFFIGHSPSVQRAWIAIVIFLVGRLCNLRTPPLNTLGIALAVELLWDPRALLGVGFQLSFLATASILLLYPTCDKLLSFLLPTRSLGAIASMQPLHKHGYLLSALLRKTLALNLAVHLFTLPALLYLFHKFPLLSLAYNLFFPFWVSLSFFLLLIATLLSFLIPPLGNFLHHVNGTYTSWLLELTSHPPALLDHAVRLKTFPFPLLVLLLSLLFCATLNFHREQKTTIE